MTDFHTCANYEVLNGSLTKLLAFFKIWKSAQRSKSEFKERFGSAELTSHLKGNLPEILKHLSASSVQFVLYYFVFFPCLSSLTQKIL